MWGANVHHISVSRYVRLIFFECPPLHDESGSIPCMQKWGHMSTCSSVNKREIARDMLLTVSAATLTPRVGSSSDFMVGQQVVILPARAAGWLWFKASSPRPCTQR